ncbi:MAG: fasciclin domain-containing protein [Salibacteraceae bacterium]
MKLRKIVLSLAVIGLLFASCDDSKKKEAEAEEAAQAEQMKMEEEAALQAEEESRMQADYEANTIAAIAMRSASFTTLTSVIQSAELAETLSSEGPYTVFGPTNQAFDKMPRATWDDLMKPENKEQLRSLLTYHVISGEFMVADVIEAIESNNNSYEVVTVQGDKLTLSLIDGNVTIKDANGKTSKVVTADIDASNGVIHTIDTVVMPKA